MVYGYSNKSLLEDVETNRSIIPSSCISFEEEAMFIQDFAESSVTSFLEDIGINELAVYENTGELVVYEGEDGKSIKEKAVEIFKNIWGAIKHTYENALALFARHALDASKKFKDVKADDVNLLPQDTIFKIHKFRLDESFAAKAESVKNQIKAKIDAGQDVDIDNEFIVKAISGTDEGSIGKAKKKIKETMIGNLDEVGPNYVKSNWNDIYGIVVKGIDKKALKKPYKEEKEAVEKAIKALKGEKNIDNINKVVKLYTKIVNTLRVLNAIKIDVCKKRLVEYTRIVAKVYARKSVAKKEKSTNESFLGYQEDMIKEAFDW